MKRVSLEKLSHYAIMVIALCALVVSVLQTRIQHNHNKLSVKPYLDSSTIQEDSTLVVTITNEGIGPAIIKNMSFIHQDKTYTNLYELLKSVGESKNIMGTIHYSKNSIFPSGKAQFITRLRGRHERNIRVLIDYESIYEEVQHYEFSF